MPISEEKLDEILLVLSRIEKALNIIPDKDTTIEDLDSSLKAYEKYAKETLKLEGITINNHKSAIRSYLNHSKGVINKETVKAYLDSNDSPSWKTNQLKALRKYSRDFLKLGNWIEDFKFKKTESKPKTWIPTDEELIQFYNELPYEMQLVFLILHNSGLRESEVLSLKLGDLDFEYNVIDASGVHKGKTKSSRYSFFTNQTSGFLGDYFSKYNIFELENPKVFSMSARGVQQAFKQASEKLGLDINPHLLRTVFAEKCRSAGISKEYIDAFQGRVSQSILEKHYTVYSLESLRKQYDKVEPLLTLGK